MLPRSVACAGNGKVGEKLRQALFADFLGGGLFGLGLFDDGIVLQGALVNGEQVIRTGQGRHC